MTKGSETEKREIRGMFHGPTLGVPGVPLSESYVDTWLVTISSLSNACLATISITQMRFDSSAPRLYPAYSQPLIARWAQGQPLIQFLENRPFFFYTGVVFVVREIQCILTVHSATSQFRLWSRRGTEVDGYESTIEIETKATRQ